MSNDWTAGLTFIDDLQTTSEGIQNGDWLNASLGAVSVGASVMDPLGTLIENGVGWLIENVAPLKDWLQELTGNPGEIQALSAGWDRVSQSLRDAGVDIDSLIATDLGEFEGEIFNAYRDMQGANVAVLDAVGINAGSIASGMLSAADMVQIVYELTRDVLSMIVSVIVSNAFTAWIPVVGQAKVAAEVGDITMNHVPTVRRSIDALLSAFEQLQKVLGDARTALKSLPEITGMAGKYGDEAAALATVAGKYGDEAIDAVKKGDKAVDAAGEAAELATDVAKHGDKAADVAKHGDTAADIAGEATEHGDDIADVVEEVIDDRPYLDPKNRPSFRKGIPEEVWENAKDADGRVWDPSGQEILWEPGTPRRNVWDMGHLPEHKYSEMHKRYLDGELTPKEFRDWYNDPKNYRPELPSTNRSHKYE